MYTTRVPRPRALRPRHSVVSQWDVLLPLGHRVRRIRRRDATEMPEDPAARAAVARRLAAAGIGAGNSIVVVHVSAGNPFRRWPAASFVELVCRLAAADPRRRIILTSGPSDAGAAARIAARRARRLGRRSAAAIVECGEFDLAELRALVGPRGALHRRRQRAAAHGRHNGRAGRRAVRADAAGAVAAVSGALSLDHAAAEVQGLPCRPCDQRRCEPGDFRCLTGISAEAWPRWRTRAGSGAG